MNIALWVIAGILAVAFGGAGAMKLASSKEKLLPNMPWVEDFTEGQVSTIGALEILGAIGIVLPPIVGIATFLAPLAAVGLTLTAIGAVVVHARRGDGIADIMPAVFMGALALFVAVMRFGSQAF